MNIEHPILRWLRKAGVFLVCCLGTAVMMRLLVLEFEPAFTCKGVSHSLGHFAH